MARPTQMPLQSAAVRTVRPARAEPTRRSTSTIAVRNASRPPQTSGPAETSESDKEDLLLVGERAVEVWPTLRGGSRPRAPRGRRADEAGRAGDFPSGAHRIPGASSGEDARMS